MKLTQLTLALLAGGLLAGCSSSGTSADKVSGTAVVTPYACKAVAEDDLRIYQVMVESFVDGDPAIGHGTGYGTSAHNGDIRGIINSLDYIQSLGMNAVWLTPVFNSVPVDGQDHWADRLDATGYFATDYFAIDPRFGTMDDARELVEKAHARGMYVLFDGVFGHHKENVVASPSGLKPVGKSNPVSYPESLPFYKEVAQYWIKELKIDGWRLDQAYQVPTPAWTEIRKAVDEASASVTYQNAKGDTVNPLGYMVAEIWNNENYITETGYGAEGTPALCSAFDFPVRYRLVETFAVSEGGTGGKGGDWLDEGMRLHSIYPDHAKPNLMIGNHDLVRFGDLLQRGDIADPADAEYWQRYRAALSFQAAYTGPITLYYGDEIGDELENFADKVDKDCAVQGLCDDHVARTDGKVAGVTNHTLSTEQKALKEYVTSLMTIRGKHPALYKGKRTNIVASQTAYVDHKQSGDDAVVYMVSTSNQQQTLSLSSEQLGSAGTLTDLESGQAMSAASGHYSVTLEPFQARFLKVDSPLESGPVGAAAAGAGSAIEGDAFMASCDNPTVSEAGPVSEKLYVVGDLTGWKHQSSRLMEYKGNGVYQLVVDEKKGGYRVQFADSDWSPQYTADGLMLPLGKETTLTHGGYDKNTAATVLDAGQYVWSLKFKDNGAPESVMLAKCQ